MIKEYSGTVIINTDIMSDLVRFVTQTIDFKNLINIDFNNYYSERSAIYADLCVIEQYV